MIACEEEGSGTMKRLLLDMDPGVDDAIALLLAGRTPGVEIVGLGTSCGNVGPLPSALNALRTLEAGRVAVDFPVCLGLDEPLIGWPPDGKPDAEFIHGFCGLGPNSRPEPDAGRLSDTSAVDLIAETYREPSDVLLVVTGPLTNVAAALRKAPQIAANIPRIVFMGGAFRVPGNIAPYGEFNVWMDPVAAGEVFGSQVPMTVIGLDVALQCPFTLADIEVSLCPEEWALGRYVGEITSHYMGFYRRNEGFDGCYLHDPLAMAVAIWPELVWTKPFHVDVVSDRQSPVFGMTVIDHRARRDETKHPRKDIALEVDAAELRRRLLDALRPPAD